MKRVMKVVSASVSGVLLFCATNSAAQNYAINLCGRGYVSVLRSGEPMHTGEATNASLWVKLDTTGISQNGVITDPSAFANDSGGRYITVSYVKDKAIETTSAFDQLRMALVNRLPVRIWTVGPTAMRCRAWSNELRIEVCSSEAQCAW